MSTVEYALLPQGEGAPMLARSDAGLPLGERAFVVGGQPRNIGLKGATLLIIRDGAVTNARPNPVATALAREAGVMVTDDDLYGPALLVSTERHSGKVISLKREWVTTLSERFGLVWHE